jgi:RES domain-containing protein
MPVTLWRIASDTPDYGADDATGEGARRTGGRWNRKGTAMLYTGATRALACLEVLAHLSSKRMPLNRYLVRFEVPEEIWAARTLFDRAAAASTGWDAEPAGLVSLDWGDRWAAARASALAEVPSVIVPEESNALVNPQHPDAARIRIRKVRKWLFDPRFGSAR